MARNEQVSRILRVLHFLEVNPNGLAAREILNKLHADGFEISRETVYRDLKAIQQAYMPLEQAGRDDNAVWKLHQVAKVNKTVAFSYDEIFALFLARESLRPLRGSPVYEVLERFFLRLEELLGSKAQCAFAEYSELFGFKARSSWQSGVSQEILDTLHAACGEGQVLEIEYQAAAGDNAGKIAMRRVGPECIYFADSGLYLIAKDLASGQHKTYSLSRIHKAVMLDEPYKSEGFSIEDHFKKSIGILNTGDVEDIEIHIADPIASYVSERRWHDSQQVLRVKDGVTIKLNVRVNDELARWVLSLGPAAKVVAPAGLKQRVQKLASEIASGYGSGEAA